MRASGHAVGEAEWFREDAYEAGMTDAEIDDLTDFLSKTPDAGRVVQGTGGCRKLRWARPGGGKSGGYRVVVTFFTGPDVPVWLITVYLKGEKENLTKAERNLLAVLTKEIVRSCKARVVSVKRRRA